MKKNEWYLVNVVWYDGVEAYVSKFILQDNDHELTKDSKNRTEEYLDGNGEILKFDICYALELKNIVAYKDSDHPEIYQRFEEMWF